MRWRSRRTVAAERRGWRGMLERPERTLNSLLLVILVCQLVSANLTGVLLEQHLGTLGFVLGIVVEIAVFFVFFEVVPKTFAIQHTDRRGALRVAGLLAFLTNFPPLRALSRGLIGLANVDPARTRPQGGPVRQRGGDPHRWPTSPPTRRPSSGTSAS